MIKLSPLFYRGFHVRHVFEEKKHAINSKIFFFYIAHYAKWLQFLLFSFLSYCFFSFFKEGEVYARPYILTNILYVCYVKFTTHACDNRKVNFKHLLFVFCISAHSILHIPQFYICLHCNAKKSCMILLHLLLFLCLTHMLFETNKNVYWEFLHFLTVSWYFFSFFFSK